MYRLHHSRRWLSVGLVITVLTMVNAQPAPMTEPIASLIEQLGDARFARREAACKRLEAIGEKALPALRKTLQTTDDREVRQRAERTIRAIMLGCRVSASTGLKLALIEPGEFRMGSPRGEAHRRIDELAHTIRITTPYLMGVYEVTQEEYQKVRKTNPSWFQAMGGGKNKLGERDSARFPVEQVSWFDVVAFCNALSALDGYPAYYQIADEPRDGDTIRKATVTISGGNGFRLPTEAEWEYACRATTSTLFHYGTENTGREANLKPGPVIGYGVVSNFDPLQRTTRVGSYPPNLWGLHDMHGNVAEWCGDWYDKDYYANSPAQNSRGPERGNHRVIRGGSWMVNEGSCRSASRFWQAVDERAMSTGFRVCRNP